jgi:hypothetical protein
MDGRAMAADLLRSRARTPRGRLQLALGLALCVGGAAALLAEAIESIPALGA